MYVDAIHTIDQDNNAMRRTPSLRDLGIQWMPDD